jgi:RimJ/RimL family protein N-acetyltransferase
MIRLDNYPVYLDSIGTQDHIQMFHWRNNYNIFKWCRQHDLNDWENHSKYMQRISNDPTLKFYAVRDSKKNQLVGICGLSSIDLINQRAEFSLYIGPEHQKHKYGKAALSLLCHWSFLHLPLNIIWGETFYGNHALKMFQSLGFRKEGRRRDFYFREGKFIDCILFSLKRGELI